MTPASTFVRLCELLTRDYPLDPTRLSPDAALDSLGIDSLGVAELLFNIDDEFGISMPADPAALHTLGEVARLIDRLVAARGGAGGPAATALDDGTDASSAAALQPPA